MVFAAGVSRYRPSVSLYTSRALASLAIVQDAGHAGDDHCYIYAPKEFSFATYVPDRFTRKPYFDIHALCPFSERCDVTLYEFENVSVAPLRTQEDDVPIRCGIQAKVVTQDREEEKLLVACLAADHRAR